MHVGPDGAAVGLSEDRDTGNNAMNITKTATLRRLAALLVLGSCSAMAAAAEIDAASTKAAEPLQATTAKAEDACGSGDCVEPGAKEQQAETMAGAELLPKLGLPALLGTEEPEDGC